MTRRLLTTRILYVSSLHPAALMLQPRDEVLRQDPEPLSKLRVGQQGPEHGIHPGPAHVLMLSVEAGAPLSCDR